MKRYVVLAASVVMQLCLGCGHAWSTFVPALKKDYGLDESQCGLIYGFSIATFALGMLFGGRLQNRRGPRQVALLGGLLLAGGWLLASFSGGNFLLLFTGIGVLVGGGIGVAYICPLVTCIKWFPDHKGLVSGLAVAGCGGGAIVLTQLAEPLLAPTGGREPMDVLLIFRLVGIVYGLVIILCGSLMLLPGREEQCRLQPTLSGVSLFRQQAFWALAVGMFAGTFGGLMIQGHLKPIGMWYGLSSAQAALAVSFLAGGNGLGRVAWGFIHDRLGRPAIPLSLLSLVGALLWLLLVPVLPAGWTVPAILAGSLWVGFSVGACFVLYVSEVATIYGHERVGAIYPLLVLAYGVSGLISPGTGGRIFVSTQSYTPALILAAVVVAGGAVATWLLLRQLRPPASATPGAKPAVVTMDELEPLK